LNLPSYNSAEYFDEPLLQKTGFREYDARWIVAPIKDADSIGLNYVGARMLGLHLGHFMQTQLQAGNEIVVGHDFREYSENVKNALALGLLQSGMNVVDIGLTTTPAAYFAQFELDVSCVAMVTASHNENGWTGVKMGHRKASTFGPTEMDAFRDQVLGDDQGVLVRAEHVDPGRYRSEKGVRAAYIDHLVSTWGGKFAALPSLRVAVECGNGTAGLYAPRLLRELGFQVSDGNVNPDWRFPHFNPNPESIPFLRSVEDLVRSSNADIGLCFDGDGDRLGVVDNTGHLVFADRVGLLIARFLEDSENLSGPFVIDVKSTSLFETQLQGEVVWAKTGHSYVKAAVAESNAVAGFERSGHFFFSEPLGQGYDDACVAALALLWTLARARAESTNVTLSSMLSALPSSHSSPNRQPYVSDETKYDVVEKMASYFESLGQLGGLPVSEVNRLNGVRLTLDDGSWLLVRASSNSPNLVIIAETFDKDGSLMQRFDDDVRLAIARTGVDVGHFESLATL